LAIADALVARGHDRSSIHYVGSARGIEATLVPQAGYELTLLPGRGIQRKLSGANIGAVLGTLRAIVRAVALVHRLRPAVVVAVGGYAAVPVALAAVLWRVPIVDAEQNAQPGAANRLIARFAKVAAVSFPGTPLPRAVVTGNPVRREVLAVDRAREAPEAKASLGIEPGRRLVLFMGGSLGARRINLAAVDAVGRWDDRDDLAVRHLVGARDAAEVEELLPAGASTGKLQYQRVEYDDDMPRTLAAADVAVCRSGASTCFELAAVGLPAVLVPSPFVTADHQTANARHLVDAGAAVLVPDAEVAGDRITHEVDDLLAHPARLAAMGVAARGLARPEAADAIAALAEEHAKRAPETGDR
jgi:undecaprenyldiphospho-muramoylpentapeptide beta-N-acetylglucosaminyltransferase